MIRFYAVGAQPRAVMAGEAYVCVADAADPTVSAGCAGSVFSSQRSSIRKAGRAAPRTSCTVSSCARPSLAIEPQLLQSGPIALLPRLLPLLSPLTTFVDLLSSRLPDLEQCFHILVSPRFFFVGGFGKLDYGIYPGALAFAGN